MREINENARIQECFHSFCHCRINELLHHNNGHQSDDVLLICSPLEQNKLSFKFNVVSAEAFWKCESVNFMVLCPPAMVHFMFDEVMDLRPEAFDLNRNCLGHADESLHVRKAEFL